MKKIYVIVISLLLSMSNCSNNELKENYFSNGKLSEKYTLVRGEFHGQYVAYYENGNIRAKGEYKKNKMVGEWIEYYENGNIFLKQKYKNGRLVFLEGWDEKLNQIVKDGTGTLFFNYPNGSKMSTSSYKDCKKDGTWISWYENGAKLSESHFSEDKPIGIWSYWDDKGNLTEEREYKDGQIIE